MRKNDTVRSLAIAVVLLTAGVAAEAGTNTTYVDNLVVTNTFSQTQAGTTNFFLGTVGIGTNNPNASARLHVAGSLKVDGAMTVPRNGDVSMGGYTNGASTNGVSPGYLPAGTAGALICHDGVNWVALTNLYWSSPDNRLYFSGSASGTYADTGTGGLVLNGDLQLGSSGRIATAPTVCIGSNAGAACDPSYSKDVIIGSDAGRYATNASYSLIAGPYAGNYAPDASGCVLLGWGAGFQVPGLQYGTMIGRYAGMTASEADYSVLIGYYAGLGATNGLNSLMIGRNAGYSAANARNSVFLGSYAGAFGSGASNSVFVGANAGNAATNSHSSVYIGRYAGKNYDRANTLVVDTDASYAPYGTNALIYGEFDTRLLRLAGITLSNGVVASPLSITATNSSGVSLMTAGAIFLASNSVGPRTMAGYAGLCNSVTNGTNELVAVDGSGNVTQISPHKEDGWVFVSKNQLTGRRVTVDMEKLAASLGALEVTWSQPEDTWEAMHRRTWELKVLQPWQQAKGLRNAWQAWRTAKDAAIAAGTNDDNLDDDLKEPLDPGPMPVFTAPPRPQWLENRLKENPELSK